MLLPLGCSYCLCDFVCVPYFLIYSDNVLAGYFLVRCLLYIFFPAYLGRYYRFLIWFGSVYLVTTAGFVADQLM